MMCPEVDTKQHNQHLFKGQHLFSLLCYASYSTHIIRYGQAKDKDRSSQRAVRSQLALAYS